MVLYIFPDSFYASPLQISPEKSQKNTRPSFVMLNPKRQILSEDSPEKTETQPRNRSYQRLVRPAEDITQKARLKPKPKPQAEPPEKPTRDPFTFNLFSVAFRN